MNLHDIKSPMANIGLIADYCASFYHFEFRIGADMRSLEYRSGGTAWQHLPERDVLAYTNRALAWHDQGRPRH